MSEEDRSKLPSYVGRTVRAFISYATADKGLARQIKDGLEKYGLETFLAHEDIQPAEERQQVILDNLESTDVFIPIITGNFPESKWTDQESGIALTHGKVIVPLSIDGHHPYGFVGRFQGMKIDSQQPIDCGEIIKAVIRRKPQLESQILDSLIKSFAASNSWTTAKERAKLFLEFEKMTPSQVNGIFQAATQNSEIQGSFGARDVLPTLYERHKEKVEKDIALQLVKHGFIEISS